MFYKGSESSCQRRVKITYLAHSFETVRSPWRTEVLPSKGLLLKDSGKWHAGSASCGKWVSLWSVQSGEALVATSVDTAGTLLECHVSEGTSELVVGARFSRAACKDIAYSTWG